MGASAPFSLYKNMDKITKSISLCYMRGTVLGLKEALVEVKEQELHKDLTIGRIRKNCNGTSHITG